jgi:hypothetical protein
MRSQQISSAAPGAWTQAQPILTELCTLRAARLGARRRLLLPSGPHTFVTAGRACWHWASASWSARATGQIASAARIAPSALGSTCGENYVFAVLLQWRGALRLALGSVLQ